MTATATVDPRTIVAPSAVSSEPAATKPRGRKANPERAAELERRKALPGADKRGRLPYPAVHKDPNYRLQAIPTDFDAKWNQPLQKENFASPALYYEWELANAEKRVISLRAKMERAKLSGAGEEGKKKAKLLKTAEAMNSLITDLKAGGMSEEQIKSLLAAAAATQPAPAAPAVVAA